MGDTGSAKPGRDFKRLRANNNWHALGEMDFSISPTDEHVEYPAVDIRDDAALDYERGIVLYYCAHGTYPGDPDEREDLAIRLCDVTTLQKPKVVLGILRALRYDFRISNSTNNPPQNGGVMRWLQPAAEFVWVYDPATVKEDEVEAKLRYIAFVTKMFEETTWGGLAERSRKLVESTLELLVRPKFAIRMERYERVEDGPQPLGYWDVKDRALSLNLRAFENLNIGHGADSYVKETGLETACHEVNHACRKAYDQNTPAGRYLWWLDEVYGYTVGWLSRHGSVTQDAVDNTIDQILMNSPYEPLQDIDATWKNAWRKSFTDTGRRLGGYERGLDLPLPPNKAGDLDLTSALAQVTPDNGWNLTNTYRKG